MTVMELPGLGGPTFDTLSADWRDDGLWDDIIWLVERFTFATGERDRRIAWHHLVMSIGNFKRQGGRRLQPGRLSTSSDAVVVPTDFEVPGAVPTLRVNREDAATWNALRRFLPGAAAPTTTTLLAAFWPDRHFVYDLRVHDVANGLRLYAGLDTTPDITPLGFGRDVSMANYSIIRGWLVSSAAAFGRPLRTVERALYSLGRRVPKVPKGEKRNWAEYAALVTASAEAASSNDG